MYELDRRLSDEELQDVCDMIRPKIKQLTSDQPEASIGFPAFDEESFMLPTLVSFAKLNTQRPLHFLGVNNGSADRTADIMSACGLEVVDEPNKGTSHARQALVEASKGDVLIQTDADTIVPPAWVEAHMSHYKDSEVLGVGGLVTLVDYHFSWQAYQFLNGLSHKGLANLGIKNLPPRAAGANFSARIESLLSVGGYEAGFDGREDRLLAERLVKVGTLVEDDSVDIMVLPSGRRFDEWKKVSTHFKKRLRSKNYWRRFVSSKIEQCSFDDIR